ncbi:MAG: hypothetical protein ACI9EW_001420 [Cellvibrionaceae bacterium]|jgi:hypothetical protein
MAKIGHATFVGVSGKTYKSSVFPFKSVFKEGIKGVYFVTRRYEQDDGTFAHEWLYVGTSSNMREKFKAHPMAFGFNKYKANSICLIREEDPAQRKLIHTDLREKYLPLLNETGYGQVV